MTDLIAIVSVALIIAHLWRGTVVAIVLVGSLTWFVSSLPPLHQLIAWGMAFPAILEVSRLVDASHDLRHGCRRMNSSCI